MKVAFPMDGVEQMIDMSVSPVTAQETILYFWRGSPAAIPTLEGTANTIANSVAATSGGSREDDVVFYCGARSAGTFIGIQKLTRCWVKL